MPDLPTPLRAAAAESSNALAWRELAEGGYEHYRRATVVGVECAIAAETRLRLYEQRADDLGGPIVFDADTRQGVVLSSRSHGMGDYLEREHEA